jgi:hypothetical protein
VNDDHYVTHAEMNGFWLQRDMERGGLQTLEKSQRVADEKIDSLVSAVGGLVADMRWGRVLLFLLLLERVAVHVFASAPAQALMAAVVP